MGRGGLLARTAWDTSRVRCVRDVSWHQALQAFVCFHRLGQRSLEDQLNVALDHITWDQLSVLLLICNIG